MGREAEDMVLLKWTPERNEWHNMRLPEVGATSDHDPSRGEGSEKGEEGLFVEELLK
jgi:hypothetical protein